VVGSEDFKPLLKLVSELVLELIPGLVKQTLCSSTTATNNFGFLSMSFSCVLTEGVRCFVDLQATFVSSAADRDIIFPFSQFSSQTSSVTVPKTVSEAGSQTDLVTGLRTDPKKNPDLLGDHVDLLNRVETQALAFQDDDC
jgi:hypothetical protein